MPDFPIVDTHLHIWDTNRLHYPWLAGAGKLNRPHTIQDYQAASGAFPIEKLIFLQCDCDPPQRHEEVAYVKEAARQDPRIQGIVPYAPVEEGEAVEAELEALAGDPLIKGIRRIVQSEADPAFCIRPGFVQGVQAMAKYNLHFEICIRHPQMASAVELVRRCPSVRFILDHIGKPDIKSGQMSPWHEQIKSLSELPNVSCKVSGMVTEADAENWTVEDLRPYADHVFDCFGFDRVMYGSDWPVATLASTYARWVETLQTLTEGCSQEEKENLFSRNARRFYRLY